LLQYNKPKQNGAKAMNDEIKAAIESLPRDNPSRREAALDTLYSLTIGEQTNTGTKLLEELFDYWLWSEGEPQEEAHKAYVIALGEIEEFLVINDLLYTDRRLSDTN
jgi:hypothetical protein